MTIDYVSRIIPESQMNGFCSDLVLHETFCCSAKKATRYFDHRDETE